MIRCSVSPITILKLLFIHNKARDFQREKMQHEHDFDWNQTLNDPNKEVNLKAKSTRGQ